MAVTGPLPFASITDDASAGTIAWTNPGQAVASDNSYATAAHAPSSDSHFLKSLNPNPSIGTSDTLFLISFSVERHADGVAIIADKTIKMVVAGTPVGANKSAAAFYGTSDGTVTFTWDQAELASMGVTPATVNSSTFGFILSSVSVAVGCVAGGTASVDFTSVNITHALIVEAVGSATGSSTVSGNANAIWNVLGAADAVATIVGNANAIWDVVGNAAGSSIVDGQTPGAITGPSQEAGTSGGGTGYMLLDVPKKRIVSTIGHARGRATVVGYSGTGARWKPSGESLRYQRPDTDLARRIDEEWILSGFDDLALVEEKVRKER